MITRTNPGLASVFVPALAVAGCSLLTPPLKSFPEDHGGRAMAQIAGSIAAAYELESPGIKVLKVGFRDRDWSIDRSPTGVILRRTVSAYVGFQASNGKCGVDEPMFAEESTGPNTWAGVRLYGIGMSGGHDIACEALGAAPGGGPSTAATTRDAPQAAAPEAPPQDFPAPDALLSESIEQLAGFTAEGTPVSRPLEGFTPFVIDGKRGSCYAVRAALAKDAVLNALARRALGLKARVHGGAVESKVGTSMLGALASVRSMYTVVGCPLKDGPINVSFNVGFDSKNPDAGAHVGTGEVVFQLYGRTIADADLQASATRQRRDSRAADDQNRTQFQKRQCKSCDGQLAQCAAGTDPANCAPYAQCIFRMGMSVSDCL